MQEKFTPLEALFGMVMTGLVIGLGQILTSDEQLTTRLIIGRALSTVGLALTSGLLLLYSTEADILVLIGASALTASLGTSFLERILQKHLGIK